MHSSFGFDYPLSRYVQANNMPVFPMLKNYFPIYQDCKVNQSVHIPGGSHKTRNNMILNRSRAQLAQPLTPTLRRTLKSEAVTSLKTKLIDRKYVKSILK